MKLSAEAEAKLRSWYGPSTWHTPHDSDMNHWYDFVSQYSLDHGHAIDETALREHIVAKIREMKSPMNEHLEEIISNRINLMYNILDFLKHTGR